MGKRKRLKLEIFKLEKLEGGGVRCMGQGVAVDLPTGALEALGRYFDEGAEVAYVTGNAFAPYGSTVRSKLRINDKTTEDAWRRSLS